MKKTQIMMMAIFILGGLVVPGASVAVAQEVGSESPEERGGYDLQRWLERMRIDPKLISDGGENNYLMSMPAWNQLVFESYHSGNWDIYTANKDGTDRVQLTTYPGTDIHPQFNRGCSRIVYASDMLGNFDIYSMQSDGSDVTLLTTVSQDDVNPQWSSDGSQIAFQSYRDGQAEIYVMKYDGSAQTRLTTNSSYDGQPSWSPDGSKIAFVSNRSGGYGIWVMNSNGSNPVQISNLAYGTSPVWSPDGARITFSADSNSDDWLELWVMNADGSNPRRIGDSYIVPGTDFIAESWSSDGTYVTTTTVKWMDVAGSGVYFWFSAKMEITNVDVNPYQGNLSGTYYLDWNAHMQTSDGIPPVTTVSALPSESPAVIGLQWSAVDDTSGVLSYDVQVRDGSGGQWVNVANGSTSIAMSYRGSAGHTYYFRVRARDKAYNAEPWNTDYDAVTTVESLPPSSEVEALPEFVRSGFSVRWNGEDAGGSEIKSYDIQYRTSTGSWQDWLVDTTTQSSKFYGNPGETYYFRSRAEDYGGVILADGRNSD
jgi:Tol biopolymer transport system component